MADGSKHSYVFDAVGLILLYAVAMASVAIPYRVLIQKISITTPLEVKAQGNQQITTTGK